MSSRYFTTLSVLCWLSAGCMALAGLLVLTESAHWSGLVLPTVLGLACAVLGYKLRHKGKAKLHQEVIELAREREPIVPSFLRDADVPLFIIEEDNEK
jgi:hypothetical protein